MSKASVAWFTCRLYAELLVVDLQLRVGHEGSSDSELLDSNSVFVFDPVVRLLPHCLLKFIFCNDGGIIDSWDFQRKGDNRSRVTTHS